MKARHNIRVCGRIDEILPSNVGPVFFFLFFAGMLIALAAAVASQ